MKSILGFSVGETQEEKVIETPCDVHNRPVPSLVTVRFPGTGPALTYYNDQYALQVGDRVFVSGKFAGQPGEVEKVTTRFKIRLSDYQRVIAKASIAIHGTYDLVLDKMVTHDENAVSPEEFRSWILPPAQRDDEDRESPEDEVIVGDGYELDLFALEHCDEITEPIAERAMDYCRSGRVAYLSFYPITKTANQTHIRSYFSYIFKIHLESFHLKLFIIFIYFCYFFKFFFFIF